MAATLAREQCVGRRAPSHAEKKSGSAWPRVRARNVRARAENPTDFSTELLPEVREDIVSVFGFERNWTVAASLLAFW